jgi:hypothetical protein
MNAESQAEPSREELIALIAAQAAKIAALEARIAGSFLSASGCS